MMSNPGIPTEKKDYDINILNYHYNQCNICNCIYKKEEEKHVVHCEQCGVCVEGHDKHYFFVTKCIGGKNGILFKVWTFSSIILCWSIFFSLII